MSLKNLIQIKNILLIFLSLFLLSIPFLLWGNTYLVGGDDTRLYYVFPKAFLDHYAFTIVSDNTLGGAMTGYAPVSYFAPIFFIIYLLKSIPLINTQMLLYGLNLALGFIGFYKLSSLYISKNNKTFYISIFAGLFYVSSIYLTKTMYVNQLLSLYLISIVPWMLYFFVKGVREMNIRLVMISVLIYSIGSTTINTLPWFAAVIVALLPILIYEAFLAKGTFLKYALLFIIVTFLLNFYWIFHLLYPYFHPSGLPGLLEYYSSSDFVQDNIRIITGVSQLYSPINIPFNQMDTNFFDTFSLYTVFQGVFFAVIVIAAILIRKLKEESTLYLIALASFLIAWFCFSPDLGNWGRGLFLYFSMHIPFFTMFRNMYDKFALPLSLTYALLFAISFSIVAQKLKKNYFIILSCLISIILLGNFYTSGQYLKQHVNDSTKFSGTFADDFTDLSNYLKSLHDPSHVVWIPLNGPTYANIKDKNLPDHYFSGLSPLRALSDMSDYAGRFGFITQSDLFLGDKLFTLLEKKDYEKVGRILQERNAKYVIVDHQHLPSSLVSFMYGGDKQTLLSAQGPAFQKVLLGQKIKDFGDTYSLYYINPHFANDKVYLSDTFQSTPEDFNELQYKKIASYLYDIDVYNLKKEKNLLFLEPYSQNWVLYLESNSGKKEYGKGEDMLVYTYANGWKLSEKVIKERYGKDFYSSNADGSINVHMQLYFYPQRYSFFAYLVSGITFLLIVLYLLQYVRIDTSEKR